ncbi:Leucine-rich repeat-containing G-protein coupled receptor 4 [Orchesella cincta]|uniref:Leucine-rich repeat-containing G-protein coupled receptor 4 n=1 Tax=Orchesella cincta TaxID=48709 RepID=A0A1D2NDW0_ORCCI|nr:Leucine-rich repeat-containing G-protein coupled receptor 4 [Orchesella cincta]
MYQNWLKEMDQRGCCKGNGTSTMITTTKRTRGSWRSWSSSRGYYNNSRILVVFSLILSVGSSMAVMAYRNDLSAISSSSSSANNRHGCVWSRTDSNGGVGSFSSNTNSFNGQQTPQEMYAPGNNPFQQQETQHNPRTFPDLSSSSSSVSPYYSSSSLPSSSSSGVLTCNVRTLNNADFLNYTTALSRDQVQQTNDARLHCSDKLYFESILSNQTLFQFKNLHQLQINACKIRFMPAGVFSNMNQLKKLGIHTDNAQWSPSVGLEIASGAFDGLSNLESLDLSRNNILLWGMGEDPKVFCLPSLLRLNISYNRLSGDLEDLGFGSNSACTFRIQSLDLSHNKYRKVNQGVFSRLTRISELKLQNNQIQEIDDNCFNRLSTLKLLDLSSNRLVAIPPASFPSSLNQLKLQNNSIILSPHVFSGLENLLLLDLSSNSLTSHSVQGDSIFSPLVRLVVLNLSNNFLTTIDSDLFKQMSSLQSLSLENNLIQTISPNAFTSLTNLHVLNLSQCRLKNTFPDSRHFSNQFVLKQLYLDGNNISEMAPDSLKNTSLEDLGCSNNFLTEVPHAVRTLSTLKSLDLGGNRISVSSESFRGLSSLLGLRLVGNIGITELPSGFCAGMRSLRILNLSEMRISKISTGAFSGCPSIRALRLDNNNALQELEPLRNQLPALLYLNASSCNIRRLDFQLFPSLEWLDLSYNQLETIVNGPNNGAIRVLDLSYSKLLTSLDGIPPNLETLRVNHCERLKTIMPDTFSKASKLRRVELIGNQLETLPSSALRISKVSSGKPLPEFYIAGNNFSCNTEIEYLTKINSQLSALKTFPHVADLEAVNCRPLLSPGQLVPLVEMSSRNIPFLSSYTSHCFATCECCDFSACDCQMTCPENFKCYHNSAWSINLVSINQSGYSNYTDIASQIPSIPMDVSDLRICGAHPPMRELKSHIFIGKVKLTRLSVNSSGIEKINNRTWNGLKSLEVLMIHDNSIQELNGLQDLKNLKQLYAHNNLLTHLPDTLGSLTYLEVLTLHGNRFVMLDFKVWELSGNTYLNSVTLSNNPFSCSCEFVNQFKKWVKSSVVDFASITCQREQKVIQDGNSYNSSAGGSTTLSTISSTTNPTISSMCAQSSFNYNSRDNPGSLLPSAVSASSGGQHAVINNHISSMGGAARIGSSLSDPNLEHSFPQNASTARNDSDAGGSGNSSFYIFLLTCIIAIVLVAVVALLIFKRGVFSKLGFGGGISAKCLSAENEAGGVDGNADYYYSDSENAYYDVYFISSQKDSEIVEKIVQNSANLRFCLHYRDLCLSPANPWNCEAMMTACNASKRVVIVLSNNLLNCEWSNPNFRTSVLSAISHQKLIVITLPPVNDQGVYSAIEATMQQQRQRVPDVTNKLSVPSITKLEWGEKDFWPKFRQLLPIPQPSATGNNNSNFATISSNATLPYATNLNSNGMNFINVNNAAMLPYQMLAGHPHYMSQQQAPLITMNWQQGISPLPMSHSVHPTPQLTPQQFGYSNVDALHNNMMMHDQHAMYFHPPQQQPQPLHFASSNNGRQSLRQQQQQHRLQHPHHNNPGQHIHSLSQLSNMSSSKSPVEVYSSSAVSSGNEEFEHDHVYAILDTPLDSPSSEFDGAISGHHHHLQLSTSSGISSGSETGGCHPPGGGGGNNMGGPPPMYFV